MSTATSLVELVRAAAKRGAETTPKIKKERAFFRTRVASKVKEAAELARQTRRGTDASKSRERAVIANQFREAGDLAIKQMLPAYLRPLLELDSEEPYIVETTQLEKWLVAARRRRTERGGETAYSGQKIPRTETNIRNLELFLKLRGGSAYGQIPGKAKEPVVGAYQTSPDTPAGGYGVLPRGGPGSKGGSGGDPKGAGRSHQYGAMPERRYDKVSPQYQKPRGGAYGDVPREPYNVPGAGVYGDVPGEPTKSKGASKSGGGAPKSKGAALQEQLLARSSSRVRVHVMASRAGIIVEPKSGSGALVVSKINVERGRILLDTLDEVRKVVAGTRGATRVVDIADVTSPVRQPHVLVAARAFEAGELVAHYDGELESSESARHIELDGVGETLRTLRAGMWAVRGYSDPDDVPRSGGLGSFAADNLDLCASVREGRECRLRGTHLNTRLVTLTHTLNALASESEYRPEESFLVLVAESAIRAGEIIFYQHMSLAEYLGGADDRT